MDVELEVRSREVCERRVGLDVSCKLSAPWLAILGGRVSSRSIRVRIFLSLSLSLPYRALPLTRSPHGFVHFSNFFSSSILSDLSAIDRGEEHFWLMDIFFFLFPPVLEKNERNSQSKSIISLSLSKTCFFISLLFDKQYFPEVFFSLFFLHFALFYLSSVHRYSFPSFFFVPLASNFARIRFKNRAANVHMEKC